MDAAMLHNLVSHMKTTLYPSEVAEDTAYSFFRIRVSFFQLTSSLSG